MSDQPPLKGPDYERMFFRCKRALRHYHFKNHELDSEHCDGCLEIVGFITQPGYRGDDKDPVGVEFERPL
jgi:hypothetical protein